MKKAKCVCFLCDSDEVNDVELGEFKKCGKISVHYFCLLLAPGLIQNGDDDEGILGFLLKDIKTEADRIKKLKCFYCKKTKPNIGCCDKKCRRSFHTGCGLANDCLMQFDDAYPSYCPLHVDQGLANAEVGEPSSKRKKHSSKDLCTICYETMGTFHPVNSVLSPCCKAHWFHKRCLAEFAKTSGYFFKCPMCNNVDQFRRAVKMRGVFVPDTDAAWETEPNAFAELLEQPDECEAEVCVCPDGRDHEDTQYQIIRCDTCGSHCVHNKCMLTKEPFTCTECILPVHAEATGAVVVPETEQDIEIAEEVSKSSNESESAIQEEDAFLDESMNLPLSTLRERMKTLGESSKATSHPTISECKSVDCEQLETEIQKETNEDAFFACDFLTCELESSKASSDQTISECVEFDQSLVDGKNISATSDVEFVETKEEILCISDDDLENPPTPTKLNQSVSMKRTLDVNESPPINPPSKKIRRALATMRNQSKITSFFNILGVPKVEKDAGTGGAVDQKPLLNLHTC